MGILERSKRVGTPKLDIAEATFQKVKDDWYTKKKELEAKQKAIFGR